MAGQVPISSGAVVMATGVLALALRLDGRHTFSSVVLGLAAAVWAGLAAVLVARAVTDPGRLGRELGELRALTLAAGSGVLGSGLALAGWRAAAIGLFVVGAGLWVTVLARLAARPPADRNGFWFLPAVATQAVANLSAILAIEEEAHWLAHLALALVILGLILYLVGLRRFPLRQLRDGGGEIWIAGGALAICAMACGDLVRAIDTLGVMPGARDAVAGLDLAVWIAAMAWLPVLVAAEVRWPRPGYTSARWATAFPVGMYAACSFLTGAALEAGGIADFARVWVWVALAVWAVTAAGLIRLARGARAARRDPPAPSGPRPRASG
jgi:tellurite resistance protein TehA-like permease